MFSVNVALGSATVREEGISGFAECEGEIKLGGKRKIRGVETTGQRWRKGARVFWWD